MEFTISKTIDSHDEQQLRYCKVDKFSIYIQTDVEMRMLT